MTKPKKPEQTKEAQILASPEGPEYNRYLKDHKRRLRRLEREATGDNMSSPPDGDYD